MKLATLIDKLKNINGVVAISQFGSYGSELWIENRSDIDLAVVVGSEISYMNTLYMEDEILPIFEAYYDYYNIHITFILFKEFTSKYARMAVDSECVFIVDENRWFDFQHYVLKYARNNSEFERKLKIDEQYTYFGGIIDESLL
jgi:predicted nucleotidyltransferase